MPVSRLILILEGLLVFNETGLALKKRALFLDEPAFLLDQLGLLLQ